MKNSQVLKELEKASTGKSINYADACGEKDYTYCHGFEVPKKAKLTDLTKKVLKCVKSKGVCQFERDDSPIGYLTLYQLRDIANGVGLTITKSLTDNGSEPYSIFVIDDDPCGGNNKRCGHIS